MEEKVDILLAIYNSNIKYLKLQMESLLNQTYSNIEVLVSDDNSSNEEVQKVLKEYAKKDDRIKLYLQKENLGYVKNFEFLLKESKANYIMFCDHDDIWYENKVEESLKKIQEENVDLVYVNAKQIDENGKTIKESYFKYKNVPQIKGKSHLAISRCIGIRLFTNFYETSKRKNVTFYG